MADYKEFYRKGTVVRYFPDNKVILLVPTKKTQKDDFFRLKSKLDTLLQIDGTKRVGKSYSLKLNDQFNVNIDEVLKSLGLHGGIEQEDAASMVDDAAKEDVEEDKNLQAPEITLPQQQPQQQPSPQEQPMESFITKGVYNFLFEEDIFKPGPTGEKRKSVKRPGKYWQALEQISGKNRNKLVPDDILEIRKTYSRKPSSEERNSVLRSLDKAADYFYEKLSAIKGEGEADRFHEEYLSLDNLTHSDYESNDLDNSELDANMSVLPAPNFSDVDYSDVDIEDQ